MPTHEGGASAAHGDEDSRTSLETLFLRIQERTATVGVMGLGYVGLPLVLACAEVFQRAIGFDVNLERIVKVNEESAAQKRFCGTANFALLRDCDVIVICVPTPLEKSKNPDLSYIRDAADRIAANLRPGQLVILESTSYPGTTDELLLPHFEAGGMVLDRDFYLAFSPERVDPGNAFPLRKIPKVIGGCTTDSALAAYAFYAGLVDVVHTVSNARAAETVKLLENTFRLVNIGLINEFAVLCNHLGIDSNEVITAAATKPFGFLPFFPGPGAGGHCIPLDPLYLNWKAKQQGVVSRFIELADDINTKMPDYVVDLVAKALNHDSKSVRDARILVVGVAYKNNVADTRQSPAIAIIDRLRYRGAVISYPIRSFQFSISTSTAGPSGVHGSSWRSSGAPCASSLNRFPRAVAVPTCCTASCSTRRRWSAPIACSFSPNTTRWTTLRSDSTRASSLTRATRFPQIYAPTRGQGSSTYESPRHRSRRLYWFASRRSLARTRACGRRARRPFSWVAR